MSNNNSNDNKMREQAIKNTEKALVEATDPKTKEKIRTFIEKAKKGRKQGAHLII